jgi:glycosyltransferase involved in cell wall biosynthesis
MTAVLPRLVPVFENAEHSEAESPADRFLVAIPAFNEERFIGSVVQGVRLEGFDCLVIDDGSSDRTVEIATAAGASVFSQPANLGKAAAVQRAVELARRRRVDCLVLMDGDWQHDPREIHALLRPIREGAADIVSGSRFLERAGDSVPSIRGIGLRALTALTNAASGRPVTDSQTGFHAFSRRALERIRFRSEGFSVEIEVAFLARRFDLRRVEVPITTRYVDPPKRNVFSQGAAVLDGLIRLVGHYRPLLFFGLPSAILMLTGMALGLAVVQIYASSGTLAGGYALLSVLLIVVGVIGVFAGLLLHVLRGIVLDLEHQLQKIVGLIERDSRAL